MGGMDRISSGCPRIDLVLHGGLPANAINLLIGAPGTGKTILADQYVFQNATEERPALYYSTVSEPHEKLLRYGQTLDFFDSAAVGRSVFYEALGPQVRAGGFSAVLGRIAGDIKAHRPGLIAIDSFRALAAYGDPREYPLVPRRPLRPADCFPAHGLLDRGVHRGRHLRGAGIRGHRLGRLTVP